MLSEPIQERIRCQNRQTMRDLPGRFCSISIATAISSGFLPLSITVPYYVAYVSTELFGCLVVQRLERKVDPFWIACLLGSATFGSALFAFLMVCLWFAPGPAPKIISFCGLTTSLLHSIMVRSTWMPFSVVSVIPLVFAYGLAPGLDLLQNAPLPDAVAGGVLILVMMSYILRSMMDMHATRSELLRKSELALEASHAKSRFLAAMSHEIRTPLNAIYGMAQTLREDPDPDKVDERTALLLKASISLKSIVDDVLDHAKIEAGRYRLSAEPAEAFKEVTEVVEMFQNLADEKGLTLSVRVVGQAPPLLEFDPLRVRQVVSNLVSNAVKFTEAGRVEVILQAREADEGWEVLVEVADDGPGLRPEDMDLLFEDFARIEREDRPAKAGTGLGLSIARGFARLMGGDITVESAPGEGARFTFSFRAMPAAEGSRRANRDTPVLAEGGQLSGVDSILLVDDTASNRYVARAMLRRYEVEIVEAENGREALDALAERPFSVVLLDMHMPVLDGLSTFSEMHKAGGRIASTPVIALTADASSDDRGRYLAKGMAGYVAKPIKRAELIAEIDRVTRARVSDAA